MRWERGGIQGHCWLAGSPVPPTTRPRIIAPRSDALARFEPAVLDNTGARWSARHEYELQPDARRFESYEMAYACKVGLGVAVQECLDLGIRRIWARVQQLAGALRAGLAGVPGVALQDRGAVLCGLVSFTVAGLTGERGRERAWCDVAAVREPLLHRGFLN